MPVMESRLEMWSSRQRLTRRALETRFKKVLNKTPHELITITRLSKAERLLRETALNA